MNKQKISENARNMFNFTTGEKVGWHFGKYSHYYVINAYKDNGVKFYDVTNPEGIKSIRIREDELFSL